MPRRMHVAALTAATVLAVPAAASAAPAPTPEQASDAALPDALVKNRPHGAGRLLHATALPKSLWPKGTAKAYRVTYLSTGVKNRPTVVSGSVFIPSATYRGADAANGRPVIGWAHDTTGVADPCAPSRGGNPAGSQAEIGAWLAKGYVVAETDYQGMGTPGSHPFLIGRSEAHGVVDIVRATHQLRGVHVSRKWLAAGHSQGGQAALFVSSMADTYGKGLDFRGSAVTAPISQWRMIVDQVKPFQPLAPGNPFLPLILSGVDSVQPKLIDEKSVLTPQGLALYRKARVNMCYHPLKEIMSAKPGTDFYHLDDATTKKLLGALETYAEIPVAKYSKPVYVAQGTADTTVFPPATQTTARELAKAGTDVTFKYYPGATHGTVQEAATPAILAWAEKQLA